MGTRGFFVSEGEHPAIVGILHPRHRAGRRIIPQPPCPLPYIGIPAGPGPSRAASVFRGVSKRAYWTDGPPLIVLPGRLTPAGDDVVILSSIPATSIL
jgi:hypothetical protein